MEFSFSKRQISSEQNNLNEKQLSDQINPIKKEPVLISTWSQYNDCSIFLLITFELLNRLERIKNQILNKNKANRHRTCSLTIQRVSDLEKQKNSSVIGAHVRI